MLFKKIFFVFFISLSLFVYANQVRIKDVARILEARSQQLTGFGLVVGLQNTGDSTRSGITEVALNNLLSKMNLPSDVSNRSRNTAAVLVTSELPPFISEGQKIDVTISSLGDATSLKGGTLILTPLTGPDGKMYAVGQGPIMLGVRDFSDSLARKQIRTSGFIPGGAIVERTISINIAENNLLTIVLNNPDFTLASAINNALRNNGISASNAIDAGTIKVPLSYTDKINLVGLISKIENLRVDPVQFSKIVINEKTGAIVFGQGVRIMPSIVSFRNINVIIGEYDGEIYLEEGKAEVVRIEPEPNINSLTIALRAVGASTSDLIAILQALKRSGAIPVELEVI